MKKYNKLTQQVLFVSFIAYLSITILYFTYPQFFHYSLLLIPLVLSVTTIVLHNALLKASKKTPIKFINKFMLVTAIKLLLYLLFVLIFILLWSPYAIPFLVIFFTLYLFLIVLEIRALLKFLKFIQINSK